MFPNPPRSDDSDPTWQNAEVLVESFFGGVTPLDTYRSIVRQLAAHTGTDRVSLMIHRGTQCALVATSVPTELDHRAAQVHSLRRLVVDQKEPRQTQLREDYQTENAVHQLNIETIHDAQGKRIASIVGEQFRDPSSDGDPASTSWNFPHDLTTRAIRMAVLREQAMPSTLPVWIRSLTWRHGVMTAGAMAILLLLLCVVQVPLWLSVPGRVVAAKQTTLFSTAEGFVNRVHVVDGDQVVAGQAIIDLRSPELDLAEQTLFSELATTQTKLAAIQTLRGGSRDRHATAESEVLRSQADGLERQLKIVKDQQQALLLTSPHAGIVHQWDAQESLSGRVVVRGQALLQVMDRGAGWEIELAISDRHAGYLIGQPLDSIECQYRLRSSPTPIQQEKLARMDSAAQLGPRGESIVHAWVVHSPEKNGFTGDLRHGASILAKVNCGSRSAAFVLMRGLIQWYREQVWF